MTAKRKRNRLLALHRGIMITISPSEELGGLLFSVWQHHS